MLSEIWEEKRPSYQTVCILESSHSHGASPQEHPGLLSTSCKSKGLSPKVSNWQFFRKTSGSWVMVLSSSRKGELSAFETCLPSRQAASLRGPGNSGVGVTSWTMGHIVRTKPFAEHLPDVWWYTSTLQHGVSPGEVNGPVFTHRWNYYVSGEKWDVLFLVIWQ